MPKCPICDKELEWRGRNPYKKHILETHPLYGLELRRLQLLAASTLIISLVLTLLVATVFFSYSPDATAYATMGLAALFLALSAGFTLKERALPKKYRKITKQQENKKKNR